MADTTHQCPAPGCTVRVPQERLACARHWYMLPAELRQQLWRAYRRGTIVEHAAVLSRCVAWFEEHL